MNATPQTTALFERQFEDKHGTDKDHWEEMTEHARVLERRVTSLEKAGRAVLDGMHARIEEAAKAGAPCPVIVGIANLHTALG